MLFLNLSSKLTNKNWKSNFRTEMYKNDVTVVSTSHYGLTPDIVSTHPTEIGLNSDHQQYSDTSTNNKNEEWFV